MGCAGGGCRRPAVRRPLALHNQAIPVLTVGVTVLAVRLAHGRERPGRVARVLGIPVLMALVGVAVALAPRAGLGMIAVPLARAAALGALVLSGSSWPRTAVTPPVGL
jgi:hypothetical protein